MNKIIRKLTFLRLVSLLGISTLPLQADYEYFKLLPSAAKPVVSTVVPAAVAGATAGVASAVSTVATTSTAAAVGIGLGTALGVPLLAAGVGLGCLYLKNLWKPSTDGASSTVAALAPGLGAMFGGAAVGYALSPVAAYFLASSGTAGLVAATTDIGATGACLAAYTLMERRQINNTMPVGFDSQQKEIKKQEQKKELKDLYQSQARYFGMKLLGAAIVAAVVYVARHANVHIQWS